MSPPTLGVCIPTASRPRSVEALLENLLGQERMPEHVVVVDSSSSADTGEVVRRFSGRFRSGTLQYVHSRRGLTLQRRIGIDFLRSFHLNYLCMLDDDVELEAAYLSKIVRFLEGDSGGGFGGLSGYDVKNWGLPFSRVERLFHKLGLYDGELRPGRWLYCGQFLDLDMLERTPGVFECDFLPGCLTVWRSEVFDHFLPPLVLNGYALGEDKHLSLRAATRYKLGVLGDAIARHERVKGGDRFGAFRMGFATIRNHAQILRDCDAHPTVRRYGIFLGVNLVRLLIRTANMLVRGSLQDLPTLLGVAAGMVASIWPPRRSADALCT